MKWRLDNVRLRNKMLILYVLSVLIPIVLTNVIFYRVTEENVRMQRQEDISRALEQISNEFQAEIEDAVTVSSVFYTDYHLNALLDTDYDNYADYIDDYTSYIRRYMNSYTPIYTSVQSIVVYVDNPTILRSSGIELLTDEVRNTDWYQRFVEEEPLYPMVMRTESNGARNTFSIIRKMNHFESNNTKEKLLKIDMKLTAINQIFQNLNLDGEVYLVNDNGLIEYTTNHELNWQFEDIYYADIIQSEDMIEFQAINPSIEAFSQWRLFGTIHQDEIFSYVVEPRNFIIVLALVNLLFATTVILWITRSMNRRLIRIVRHMKKVKNQNFDTIRQADSMDEIGQLTREFNRMTLRIQSLINDVYVRDLQKKELALQKRNAQLNALQSQINPHFLFNALETIRMRSLMKKEEETADIIHSMAKILRNSFTWTNDFVTVQQELELIKCFLDIQTYRFSGKLTYDMKVEEDTLQCLIPKMSFLPFVENASIHGIEATKEGGRIDINIRKTNNLLIFTLQDNGIGMSEEVKNRLMRYRYVDEQIGDRIGVQNVIYRLRLYYADRFEFDIQSKQGQGTRIHIEIPINEEANLS